MSDTTPGVAKAISGTGAAIVGGAVAKIIIRIIQVHAPTFLDAGTLDAIDVLATAGAVALATYLTPHQIGGSSASG